MPATPWQRLVYRDAFRSLFHHKFQSWFETLARALHEPGDFLPIRVTRGDGGLDGIVLSSGLVYQVYAPGSAEHADSKVATKISGDFERARQTLGDRLRAWSFLHNHLPADIGQRTAQAVTAIQTAHPAITVTILDIESLWVLLSDLPDDILARLFPHPDVDAHVREAHTSRAAHELAQIRRRRTALDVRAEIAALAARVGKGDLQHADLGVQAEVLRWAVRLHAVAETLPQARTFHTSLLQFDAPGDTAILDAQLLEAAGDADGALRALRDRENPDARAVLLAVRRRARGAPVVLAWFDEHPAREQPHLLTGLGWYALAHDLAQAGRWENAGACLARLHDQWADCPALPLLEGVVRVALLLPTELRGSALGPLPYLSGLRPVAGPTTDSNRHAAIECFEEAERLWCDLHPPQAEAASTWLAWLRLTDPRPDVSAAAHAELRRRMTDGRSILHLLPLARNFGIEFDVDKARRYLAQRLALGGLDDDERYAELALNEMTLPAGEFLLYLAREDDRLRRLVGDEAITHLKIQYLIQAGQVSQARALFDLARAIYEPEESGRVEILLQEREGVNPRPALEAQFAATGHIADLASLIQHLLRIA